MLIPFTEEIEEGQVKSWTNFAKLNVNYMHWSLPTYRPLVNGYSGQRSKIMREYPRKMSGFPDRRSLDAVSLIAGLRYIVYASQYAKNFDKAQFLSKAGKFSDEIEFLMGDDAGNFLFEFKAAIKLRDAYYLLYPKSDQEATLSLEVMAEAVAQPTDFKLRMQLADREIAQFAIQADGEWRQYTIALPASGVGVRPEKVRFEYDLEGGGVYIKNVRYQNQTSS